MRTYQYGFPPAVLEPGTEATISVELGGKLFRAQKLVMAGQMDVIRGCFKIKYSRLPLLDRDEVTFAATRIRRWSNGKTAVYKPVKTTVTYRGKNKSFTREYLPSNVIYIPTDPLEYITLLQFSCGKECQMPETEDGASALFFTADVLGNGLLCSSTDASLTMQLKNVGDVQVRVHALVFGYGL